MPFTKMERTRNFANLSMPVVPTPGTWAALRLDNAKYNGKAALVLRRPDADGRVVVFVYDLHVQVRVRECALSPTKVSSGTVKHWFRMPPAQEGFPSLSDVAIIFSDSVLRALCDMGLGTPQLVLVNPSVEADPLKCHRNAWLATRDSGTPVFGYSLLPAMNSCQCVQFEAHSIVRRKDGQLDDVTPDWEGLRAKFFVAETMFDYEAWVTASEQSPGSVPIGRVLPSREMYLGESSIPCSCPFCQRSKPRAEQQASMALAANGSCALPPRVFRDELIKLFPAKN